MKVNNLKNQKSVAEAYAAYDAKANAKDSSKMINEAWAPMIERTTGVKDAEKLSWMSQLAHNTAKQLNEDAFLMPSNAHSAFGNAYSPYNTLYNTVGVGNAVPAGKPALTGADFANDSFNGSGDKYPALLPLALKVAAKTIGFELVNTTPLAGPTGVLPYMDYVYAGSKQPFGATPAYNVATANPARFNQVDAAGNAIAPYSQYGLPSMFQAAIYTTASGSSVLAIKTELNNAGVGAGTAFVGGTLKVELIGYSRINGDPMFKVVAGDRSLADYFAAGPVTLTSAQGVELPVYNPKLVSMLEDQIQGFTGAGEYDSNPWYGSYQDGTVLYDPMSRATGEMSAPRQISMQLFTKNVTVGTIQVGCAVTQEQVTDLQKQWGIDVVKIVENAGINELSATINRHITSRLFALGWKNHVKLVEVEGAEANMNLTFTPSETTQMTKAYAIPATLATDEQTQTYTNCVNVALPFAPYKINLGATAENRDTLTKRIFVNILQASNWIQQRGRQGAATFVVTNIRVASLLQADAHYAWSPIENNISQTAGQLYPVGTVCGLTVYVDPQMQASDTRVLVGRKGGKDEPGVHFCPYVMAEVVRTIAEATGAPKLYIKSRYALVDAGFYPETQYLTFVVDTTNI